MSCVDPQTTRFLSDEIGRTFHFLRLKFATLQD
jgi:hypothetical protein